jgi:hypothetical protein
MSLINTLIYFRHNWIQSYAKNKYHALSCGSKKKILFAFAHIFRVWQVIINNVFKFVSDQSLSTTIMQPYFV